MNNPVCSIVFPEYTVVQHEEGIHEGHACVCLCVCVCVTYRHTQAYTRTCTRTHTHTQLTLQMAETSYSRVERGSFCNGPGQNGSGCGCKRPVPEPILQMNVHSSDVRACVCVRVCACTRTRADKHGCVPGWQGAMVWARVCSLLLLHPQSPRTLVLKHYTP